MSMLTKLAARLTLDTKGYRKGLQSAEQKTGLFASKIVKLGPQIAAAFSIVALVKFSSVLADLSKDISNSARAFQRFGDAKLLDDLRKSTGGMVNDLKLMQQAIQAVNLNLNAADLPAFFKFAAIRAAETGMSVDHLVESIVTGIGRESRLVLDNLGISLIALNKEIARGGTFAEAATRIIKRVGDESNTSIKQATKGTKEFNSSVANLFNKIAASDIGDFFNEIFSSASKVVDAIAKVRDSVTNQLKEEQGILNSYVKEILDLNTATSVRVGLIKELQGMYPSFLKNLDAEKVTNEQIEKALKGVNEQYKNRINESLKADYVSGAEADYAAAVERTGRQRETVFKLEKKRSIWLGNHRMHLIYLVDEELRLLEILIRKRKEADVIFGGGEKKGFIGPPESIGIIKELETAIEKATLDRLNPRLNATEIYEYTLLIAKLTKELSDLMNVANDIVEPDIGPIERYFARFIELLDKHYDELAEARKRAAEAMLESFDMPEEGFIGDTPFGGILPEVGSYDDLIDKATKYQNTLNGINESNPSWEHFKTLLKEVNLELEKFNIDEVTGSLQEVVSAAQGVANAVEGMSNAINGMMFGDDILASFGQFLTELASLMLQFGTLLAAFGTAEEAFKWGDAYTKIAAGIAMVGLAISIASSISKIGKKGGGSLGGASAGGGSYSSGSAGTGEYDYNREIILVARGDDLAATVNRSNERQKYLGGK